MGEGCGSVAFQGEKLLNLPSGTCGGENECNFGIEIDEEMSCVSNLLCGEEYGCNDAIDKNDPELEGDVKTDEENECPFTADIEDTSNISTSNCIDEIA